jgi:alpha-D-ribose 1-methylphosphonate 5-triphosphate synthase subunit PhnL
MIRVRALSKTFTLHNQDGMRLPVLERISFQADAGDCLVLSGPSGAGKSTLLRCLYGNYLASAGSIQIRDTAYASERRSSRSVVTARSGAADTLANAEVSTEASTEASASSSTEDAEWLELAGAPEQRVLHIRRHLVAYVSQFLRVIPRVSALDVVAEPLLQRGVARGESRDRAASLMQRLHLPERLWTLPPATFSGGEQQRVNIARGFIDNHPILLIDEPTASLDADNRAVVIALIREACLASRCVIGIFHDESVRDAVATRFLTQETVASL